MCVCVCACVCVFLCVYLISSVPCEKRLTFICKYTTVMYRLQITDQFRHDYKILDIHYSTFSASKAI